MRIEIINLKYVDVVQDLDSSIGSSFKSNGFDNNGYMPETEAETLANVSMPVYVDPNSKSTHLW